MKRRILRNLGMILAVAIVFGGVVGVNRCLKYFYEDGPAARAFLERTRTEFARAKKGQTVVPWTVMAKTGGTSRAGLHFEYDLKSKDGKVIYMIGYMAPVTEGEMVDKFLLLPLTLESYWRRQPPLRDVVFVALPPGYTTPLVEEPVLVDGMLRLNTTTDGGFYYCIDNAAVGPAMPEEKPRRKSRGEPPSDAGSTSEGSS